MILAHDKGKYLENEVGMALWILIDWIMMLYFFVLLLSKNPLFDGPVFVLFASVLLLLPFIMEGKNFEVNTIFGGVVR
jgi:hypothetical protein